MDTEKLFEKSVCDGVGCSKIKLGSDSDEQDTPKHCIVKRNIPLVRDRPDSFEYAMDYPIKGKCYIFNHEHFKGKKKLQRHGTEEDAKGLESLFKELGFDVERYNDLTKIQVIEKLFKASKDDRTHQYSCLICCILTHGFTGRLMAHDGLYSLEKVFMPFRDVECEGLRGKPKLFFIQACRGGKRDPGVPLIYADSIDEEDVIAENMYMRIPISADYLIAYSTVPNYVSWRGGISGSWFIQALLPVLKEHANHMDLVQMLTIVNRKVAIEKETPASDDPMEHRKKQAPYFLSTLTKLVKLCAS